jgi:hypothetical protein
MPPATFPDEVAEQRQAHEGDCKIGVPGRGSTDAGQPFFLTRDFFLARRVIDFFFAVATTFFAFRVTAFADRVSALLTVGPLRMDVVFFLAAILVPPFDVAIDESFLREAPESRGSTLNVQPGQPQALPLLWTTSSCNGCLRHVIHERAKMGRLQKQMLAIFFFNR